MWCLSQDLQGYQVPSFGRAVCLGSRDSLVLMENNEGSCLHSPRRLQFYRSCSVGGGGVPASPPPMGRFRPAYEPCPKPTGGWAFSFVTGFSFPRFKNWHQWYSGTLRQGHLEFACLGPPFCTVLTLEVREKWETWEAAGGRWGWHPDSSAHWF